MTVRELRKLLFEVSEPNITVNDLRSALFMIIEQDNEATVEDIRGALHQMKEKELAPRNWA